MIPAPGGQGGILVSRVGHVVQSEWAEGVALALGVPGKTHWLGSISF